jgi:hypothetical protein
MTDEHGVRVLEGDDMTFQNVEGVGYVRPAVVRQLVLEQLVNRGVIPNRRDRRALRRHKGRPPVVAPAIALRSLSERETTDRVAKLLLDEWDSHRRQFPHATLSQFFDDKTGAEVERAWREGKPIDRDAVRRGIGQLWEQAQRKQRRNR